MKFYTKVYLHFFDYTGAEFIPCEIPECGRRMVDVMHIHPHSTHPELENDIKNLMGGCRECHEFYEQQGEEAKAQLQEWHNEFMREHGVNREPLPEPVKRGKYKKLYNTFKKT